MIFSSAQGFKFPDSTVQTSAVTGFSPSDVSEERGIIIMDIDGIPGPFT